MTDSDLPFEIEWRRTGRWFIAKNESHGIAAQATSKPLARLKLKNAYERREDNRGEAPSLSLPDYHPIEMKVDADRRFDL